MSNSKELIDEFLNYCDHIRSLSRNSIHAYRQDLMTLFRFLKQDEEVDALEGDRILDFLSFLKESRKNSATTIRRRWGCLRLFYRWLEDQGVIEHSPCRGLDIRISVPKRLPRALSQAQLENILKQTSTATQSFKENKASPCFRTHDVRITGDLTIRLMAATGIRVGELSSLRLKDVSQDAQNYHIRGKGSRERVVYVVNESLRHELQHYLETRLSESSNFQEPFFLNRNRSVLTPQTIRHRLKKISETMNETTRITPHRFRHTAATLLLDEGVDIRFVQRLLGHSTISTTEIYTHVTDKSLKAILKNADTMAKLR